MIKRFIPDVYSKNVFTINYNKLKKKGIKCILFDLDNTLSPAKEAFYDEKVKKLFKKLKKDFKIIIFSNNFKKRVKYFGDFYDVDVAFISLKPLSYKYFYIMRKHGFKSFEVACVGDQLMTDIQGGNKVGMTTILVEPICDLDGKSTFFNRWLEKKVFVVLEKRKILIKGKYYE